MISVQLAIKIHERAIVGFGGICGVRDKNLPESVLSRPFQTFDGIDLYSTIYLKASAILDNILVNHPFVDGNKRAAYLLKQLCCSERVFI